MYQRVDDQHKLTTNPVVGHQNPQANTMHQGPQVSVYPRVDDQHNLTTNPVIGDLTPSYYKVPGSSGLSVPAE